MEIETPGMPFPQVNCNIAIPIRSIWGFVLFDNVNDGGGCDYVAHMPCKPGGGVSKADVLLDSMQMRFRKKKAFLPPDTDGPAAELLDTYITNMTFTKMHLVATHKNEEGTEFCVQWLYDQEVYSQSYLSVHLGSCLGINTLV